MSDFDTAATAAPAKERPDLGAAFIATNKKSPSSYDMSGTIVVDGVKHRFGAYQQKASGKGKMPEGTTFYTFYRVEPAEEGSDVLASRCAHGSGGGSRATRRRSWQRSAATGERRTAREED